MFVCLFVCVFVYVRVCVFGAVLLFSLFRCALVPDPDESGSPSLQHGAESAFYSMLEEEEECGVVERAGPGGSGEGESSEDAFLKQKSKANEDLILRLMESGDGS